LSRGKAVEKKKQELNIHKKPIFNEGARFLQEQGLPSTPWLVEMFGDGCRDKY
jgi:hypothetical protein